MVGHSFHLHQRPYTLPEESCSAGRSYSLLNLEENIQLITPHLLSSPHVTCAGWNIGGHTSRGQRTPGSVFWEVVLAGTGALSKAAVGVGSPPCSCEKCSQITCLSFLPPPQRGSRKP